MFLLFVLMEWIVGDVEEEEKWKDWFEEEKDNGKVVDLKEFVDILKKLKFE